MPKPKSTYAEANARARAEREELRRKKNADPAIAAAGGLIPGSLSTTWEGRARMASARRAAGLALDELDAEALRRHPEPTDGLTGQGRLPGVIFDEVAEVTPAQWERLGELAGAEGLRAGQIRRDDALDAVEEHAPADWKAAAREAIVRIAASQPELTGDDLWRLVPKPDEPRASGAVFRWAANAGIIAPTERFVPTTQATSHASPSRVWRSLTYDNA